LVKNEPDALAKLFAIPSFFFAGMAVTMLVHSTKGRPHPSLAWSLVVECMLLIGVLVSFWTGAPFRTPDMPGAIMALLFGMAAMGVQSALVRLLMRNAASTNVMTTNTSLLAINAAEILLGWIERCKVRSTGTLNPNYAQAQNEFAALLPLGLGFFVGTALGALAYINMGLSCISFAILPVGSLALWYMRRSYK
jgi:uncharacterized membrane protein YoaK (UPF0700 family)